MCGVCSTDFAFLSSRLQDFVLFGMYAEVVIAESNHLLLVAEQASAWVASAVFGGQADDRRGVATRDPLLPHRARRQP